MAKHNLIYLSMKPSDLGWEGVVLVLLETPNVLAGIVIKCYQIHIPDRNVPQAEIQNA